MTPPRAATVVAWALLLAGFQAFAQTTNSIPSELRQSSFSCDRATIDKSLSLRHAGWVYIMPVPKSKQAAWGNSDGRTTWFVGYWLNETTRTTSLSQPAKTTKAKSLATEAVDLVGAAAEVR